MRKTILTFSVMLVFIAITAATTQAQFGSPPWERSNRNRGYQRNDRYDRNSSYNDYSRNNRYGNQQYNRICGYDNWGNPYYCDDNNYGRSQPRIIFMPRINIGMGDRDRRYRRDRDWDYDRGDCHSRRNWDDRYRRDRYDQRDRWRRGY